MYTFFHIEKMITRNRIIFVLIVLIVALVTQSCGKPVYVFGSLTKANFYPYSPEGAYNNQGGVDWAPKIGVQLGVATNVAKINDRFTLRTELNTSCQGSRYDDVSNHVKGNIKLLYAYIPLILRYQSKTGLFGEAGVQPGILLIARDRSGSNSNFYLDYLNKLDIGITGGLGYQISNKISVGLNGYLGFRNISAAGTDAKTNVLVAIRATYKLTKE
jgi:hypothetical protein